MPKLPFRSSSVKVKGSGQESRKRRSSSGDGGGGAGGLFSRNRSRGDEPRPSTSMGSGSRPNPNNHYLSPEPPHRPLARRESRSHDSVPRPPPVSSNRRGRSPPKRRSTYRSSISPPSHRGSSRDNRRPSSPQRRRYSSDLPRPSFSPTSLSPPHEGRNHEDTERRSRLRYQAGDSLATTAAYGASHPHSSPSRYPKQSSSSRRASASHGSPRHHGEPHRKEHQNFANAHAHQHEAEAEGMEGFVNRFPKTFMTYAAVKELSKHADTAKKWIEWLSNVNGAPEEIRVLSSRVTIAKDTVKQIQESLEARPDLIEDESGQKLKLQIDDTIDNTTDTLRRMTKLLASFSDAAGQDGTALGRLGSFWQSMNYKNEGEMQIRDADAELQLQLTELSNLMSNVYARAIRSPGLSPQVLTPDVLTPAPSPSSKPQETSSDAAIPTIPTIATSDTNSNFNIKRKPVNTTSRPSTASHSPKPSVVVSDIPPLSPSNKGDVEPPPAADSSPVSPKSKIPSSPGEKDNSSTSPAPNEVGGGTTPQINVPAKRDARDILLDATWDGDLKAVALALRKAHANSCDIRGLTALHLAAERDHMAVAMLLLDREANIHARADGGCMPLHLAARYASADIVEMLVERGGADVNARTTDGRTPLHYAARSAADGDEERREVIRALRDLGANPTLTTKKGESARDVAQKRDYWDASATLRRAEKKWEEKRWDETQKPQKQQQPQQQQQQQPKAPTEKQQLQIQPAQKQQSPQPKQNWFQRHGFMKSSQSEQKM